MAVAMGLIRATHAAAPVVDGFASGHAGMAYVPTVDVQPRRGGGYAAIVNGVDGSTGVEGYIDSDGNTRDSAGVRLPLLLDGKPLGEVVVGTQVGGSGSMVFWKEARTALAKVVEEDALAGVDGKVREHGLPLGVSGSGIGLAYDPDAVAVAAYVPPSQRRMQDVEVQDAPGTPLGAVVEPAAVSAYLNMYGATTYRQDAAVNRGLQPVNLDFDGALNVSDWVLEGRVNYLQDEPNPLLLDDTRLVRDDPTRMLRYQVGQVSYPVTGFQRFRPMLGAGVARNFSLQPYRVTQPVGRSEFVLNSPATVDIYVNGARVKTLQLAAGAYALSDFPVMNGANNVKLVITDATGRSEEKIFPVVSDSSLLARGLSEFSLNGGIPMDGVNRGLSYDAARPAVAGLWRHGMDDLWTLGGNFEGDSDNQLAGFEQTRMTDWGLVASHLAVSRGEQGLGAGGRVEYRWLAPQRAEASGAPDMWQASAEVQSQRFNLQGHEEINRTRAQMQGSYSHSFGPRLGMTTGLSYRAMRGEQASDYRASSGLYYRPLDDVFVTLDGSYSLQDKLALLLNVAWTPGNKNDTLSMGYDTANDASTLRWARHRQSNQAGLDTELELEKSRDDVGVNGALAYAGERGNVRLEHDRREVFNSKVQTTRTQLSGATALVVAGDTATWTAPVANSFAIVTAADGVKDTRVEINPMLNGDAATYDARSSALGLAVVRDLSAYTPRSIYAEVGGVRGGENTNFVLKPTYKSGLHVVAGMPGKVAVQGVIVDAHEQPLALQAAELQLEQAVDAAVVEPAAGNEKKEPRLVFTNREGVFRVEGLVPGRYRIVLADSASHSVGFVVPDRRLEEINLGSYKVDMLPGRSMSTKVQ